MKTRILDSLDRMPYFTIEAVKQLLEETSPDDGSIRTTIYRWTKAGDIVRLKKGVYMTRRFYEAHRSDEEFASMVSAILIPQSYLSLEYILQRNNILTDITYPITAVTLKQTRVFENKLGTFSYRNIKPALYHGFTFSEYSGIPIAKAPLAKALFDYLYCANCRCTVLMQGIISQRNCALIWMISLLKTNCLLQVLLSIARARRWNGF